MTLCDPIYSCEGGVLGPATARLLRLKSPGGGKVEAYDCVREILGVSTPTLILRDVLSLRFECLLQSRSILDRSVLGARSWNEPRQIVSPRDCIGGFAKSHDLSDFPAAKTTQTPWDQSSRSELSITVDDLDRCVAGGLSQTREIDQPHLCVTSQRPGTSRCHRIRSGFKTSGKSALFHMIPFTVSIRLSRDQRRLYSSHHVPVAASGIKAQNSHTGTRPQSWDGRRARSNVKHLCLLGGEPDYPQHETVMAT